MRLAMMSYTWSRQSKYFDVGKMLEQTRELKMAGVDFVTLHGFSAKELRKMADGHGVPVVCHTFLAKLNAPDPCRRKEAVETARRGIEDAVTLGAPVVMIPTPKMEWDKDRRSARRQWIEGLKEVQPSAAAAKVTLTVENFPGADSPFVVASDVLEAVGAVPGLKITFDSGNAAGGEDPVESFRRSAAHVVHAHFKDWVVRATPADGYRRMLDGRYWKPALIGEGVVDHKGCLAAMKEAGYQGCINIEYEGSDYTPAEATRRAVEYLRRLDA